MLGDNVCIQSSLASVTSRALRSLLAFLTGFGIISCTAGVLAAILRGHRPRWSEADSFSAPCDGFHGIIGEYTATYTLCGRPGDRLVLKSEQSILSMLQSAAADR